LLQVERCDRYPDVSLIQQVIVPAFVVAADFAFDLKHVADIGP
jgi:hypothetical protein